MGRLKPRYNKEEFARRGDVIYEQHIRPQVESGNEGKFVAIDLDTGAYELAEDEITACDHLLSHYPEAQTWLVRVGRRHVRRFGRRGCGWD